MKESKEANELRELAETVVTKLVDYPDQVKITCDTGESTLILSINVNKNDLGPIIGKSGKNITMIRTLLRAVGAKSNHKVYVELVDDGRQDYKGRNHHYQQQPEYHRKNQNAWGGHH